MEMFLPCSETFNSVAFMKVPVKYVYFYNHVLLDNQFDTWGGCSTKQKFLNKAQKQWRALSPSTAPLVLYTAALLCVCFSFHHNLGVRGLDLMWFAIFTATSNTSLTTSACQWSTQWLETRWYQSFTSNKMVPKFWYGLTPLAPPPPIIYLAPSVHTPTNFQPAVFMFCLRRHVCHLQALILATVNISY
jgi:hypothetical protein